MVPPEADQVIAELETPGMVAVNCCVAPAITVAVAGKSEIAETVTVALAVTEESAALVAPIV
jgi:hypothetical protein